MAVKKPSQSTALGLALATDVWVRCQGVMAHSCKSQFWHKTLEIPPQPNLQQGRASKSSWPNMRRRELSRIRRNDQMKPKVTSQRQHLVSNQILTYIKVIVLLRQILSRLLHGSGHILVIIYFWIIVGCIYNHIIVNFLLCIQAVSPKDRLAILW